MLALLETPKNNWQMASGAALPQLSGILPDGLYQLSLTKAKKEKSNFKLVAYGRPARDYVNYFATSNMDAEARMEFYITIPLCTPSLRAFFGIIPSVIYVTKLK